jgi:hypothetical protein
MIKTQDAICYYMQTQSEPDLRESQLAQKGELHKEFLLSSGGRETSPKTDRQDQQYPLHRWKTHSPPQMVTGLQMASTTPVGFGRQWALLHEVQVSIMVSIISIPKPFDYVVS